MKQPLKIGDLVSIAHARGTEKSPPLKGRITKFNDHGNFSIDVMLNCSTYNGCWWHPKQVIRFKKVKSVRLTKKELEAFWNAYVCTVTIYDKADVSSSFKSACKFLGLEDQ